MLLKKLVRTAGRYRAQFISMIIMTALGIGMFLGFNMEWVSLENNMASFFEETGFADYRILSEEGFDAEDLDKVRAIDGVSKAEQFFAVNADLSDTGKTLAVTMTTDPSVSGFVLMEGNPYDENSADGMWLFDKFAEKNGITIGDTLNLSYDSFHIKGVVEGLIESSEYMICLQDETQLMPAFDTFGYVYISPAALENVVSDAVRDGIRDMAKKLLKGRYTEEKGEQYVEKMFDQTYENAWNGLFHQINVISDLGKNEFKEQVNQTFGKTMIVLTKDETVSYSEAKGEATEGKTMGLILPVLFLLISILTMVTTMHRIASNEKTQIGTLKALGFKDRRILRHYSSYTLMIGVVGTVLGIVLGYFVAWFIMNPDGTMGTYIVMPEWKLFIPWWCWLVMAAVICLMVLIGRISVRQMMKGTAADALRPFVPKVTHALFLERTKLWERLRFGTKWNLRDIVRHKSRSIVTLIGVLGCMILMVAGLGMYETASAFIQINYVDHARYASKIYLSDTAPNADAIRLAQELQGDSNASVSVQMQDETYGMDIYHIDHDLVQFIDRNNQVMELPDDGAFVCLRIQEQYGLKVGDEITVSLFGSDAVYTMRIAGFNRSMAKNITISDAYAQTLLFDGVPLTESDFYKISTVYTETEKADIPDDSRISSIQSKSDIADSMNNFMEIMNLAVIILVIAAIVLGIVVLYNLGIMSYTERYREMATLKVVGFKNRKIRSLLISQNTWLTILGIVIGVFAGIGVLEYLMAALAPEYEMKAVIGPLTIIVSIAVTFAVSMLVGLMVSRKSRKVDMVVALKTPE